MGVCTDSLPMPCGSGWQQCQRAPPNPQEAAGTQETERQVPASPASPASPDQRSGGTRKACV